MIKLDMSSDKSTLTNNQNIEDSLKELEMEFDPKRVIRLAKKSIRDSNRQSVSHKDDLFKALSLYEFSNGILMSSIVAEKYRTFSINLSREIQEEYHCQSPSEKATAELVAINYVRIMEIQRKLNNTLQSDGYDKLTNERIAVLSKELDRATRHYHSSIHSLQLMKQSPLLNIKVKTQTAIVGNNQVVQTNNKC